MILTVGNTKGGVGKTTIAVNAGIVRAAAGRDVLLIDGNEQQTAITFTELRSVQLGQPGYTAVSSQAARSGRRSASSLRSTTISSSMLEAGTPAACALPSPSARHPDSGPAASFVSRLTRSPSWSGKRETLNPEMRACIFLNAADAQGHDNEDSAMVLKDAKGIEL